MTDQLTPPTEEDAPGRSKFTSEIMAGGAVTENLEQDGLAGGMRGALSMLVILGLFAWLGFANFWIFVFVVEGHPVLPLLWSSPVEFPSRRDRIRRAGSSAWCVRPDRWHEPDGRSRTRR